ncbi:hypothetical protein HanRHA438_Chr12g0556601 [Helianthus annuus]|nr:hypothetical protein HanRHA438_Chr12g0556601 [Helianthus annuus]
MVSSSIPNPPGFYRLCIVVPSGGCRVGFSRNWWHGGLGALWVCRLGCHGLPFGQWVPRTEYPAILMLDVQKKIIVTNLIH